MKLFPNYQTPKPQPRETGAILWISQLLNTPRVPCPHIVYIVDDIALSQSDVIKENSCRYDKDNLVEHWPLDLPWY
jgi:hypothetical protein